MSLSPEDPIAAVRHFSRFYTGRLEVLREGLLDSAFTLAEARVLYELANRTAPTAADLGRDLNLDAGYLSRILKRFEEQGLLRRERSAAGRPPGDAHAHRGRPQRLRAPRRALALAGRRPPEAAAGDERAQLVAAMRKVEALLSASEPAEPPYALRPHRPGDIGWIVHRHGALYAQEYGFDESFEALVAEIAAGFIKSFDPKRERCWIAEKDGKSSAPCFS